MGGVAVDVGVTRFMVADAGVDIGDLIDGLHQGGTCLPGPGPVGPIKNIGLGGIVKPVVHELPLHRVLNGLDVGGLLAEVGLQPHLDIVCHPGRVGGVALSGGLQGLQDRHGDLILVIQDHPAVTLDNALNHVTPSFSRVIAPNAAACNTTSCGRFLFLHYILTYPRPFVKGEPGHFSGNLTKFCGFLFSAKHNILWFLAAKSILPQVAWEVKGDFRLSSIPIGFP